MISSFKEYKYYLECDRVALNISRKLPRPFTDYVWRFQRLLRRYEYVNNCKPYPPIIQYIALFLIKIRFSRMSVRLGFDIPINVIGPGLCIVHPGTIVISRHAKIGKNFRIHEGVTIGATNKEVAAATIGDNVFISSGAKIIGAIKINDNVAIAANAVVIKDIDYGTHGGVPSHKISDHTSEFNLRSSTDIVNKYFGI